MKFALKAATAMCVVAMAVGTAHAQAPGYETPKTTWGAPDLQGFWNNTSITSLQRPGGVDKLVLSPAEADRMVNRNMLVVLTKEDESTNGEDPNNTKLLEDVEGMVLHDILSTGAGGHPDHLGTYALSDDRVSIIPLRYRSRVDVHDLVAGCLADRRLTPYHELAPHPDFRPFCILMFIKKFPGHRAADFLNPLHLTVDGLLQHVIDHLEVP